MYFFGALLYGAALVTCALAQVSLIAFTSIPSSVEGGMTYNLTWAGGDGVSSVTIILREGDPSNLSTIETITTNATGYSYLWTVPTNLPTANDYALQILQGLTDINYSGRFALTQPNNSTNSTSSGAASSSANMNGTSTSSGAAGVGTAASMGNSTTMSRNTTFSSMSLTASSSSTATTPASASATTTTAGAGATTTSSSSGNGAVQVGGSFALAMGVLGAIFAI